MPRHSYNSNEDQYETELDLNNTPEIQLFGQKPVKKYSGGYQKCPSDNGKHSPTDKEENDFMVGDRLKKWT